MYSIRAEQSKPTVWQALWATPVVQTPSVGPAGFPPPHAHRRARDFSQLDLATWCAEPGATLR